MHAIIKATKKKPKEIRYFQITMELTPRFAIFEFNIIVFNQRTKNRVNRRIIICAVNQKEKECAVEILLSGMSGIDDFTVAADTFFVGKMSFDEKEKIQFSVIAESAWPQATKEKTIRYVRETKGNVANSNND